MTSVYVATLQPTEPHQPGLGFTSFRVIYPYLKADCSTCNSYVQKSLKIVLGFTVTDENNEIFQVNKVLEGFLCPFFVKQGEQSNLLEYKDKS